MCALAQGWHCMEPPGGRASRWEQAEQSDPRPWVSENRRTGPLRPPRVRLPAYGAVKALGVNTGSVTIISQKRRPDTERLNGRRLLACWPVAGWAGARVLAAWMKGSPGQRALLAPAQRVAPDLWK